MRARWLMVCLAACSCTFDYGILKGKAAEKDGAADAPIGISADAPQSGGGTGGTVGSGGSTVSDAAAGGAVGSGGATASGGGVGTGGASVGGTGGTGGLQGTGGLVGTGGLLGTGGVARTGGAIGTGGLTGVGGTVALGGTPGSGGLQGTGGVIGTGGLTGVGGTVASGGTPGSGGLQGTGGGTGGTGGAVGGTGGTSTARCTGIILTEDFATATLGNATTSSLFTTGYKSVPENPSVPMYYSTGGGPTTNVRPGALELNMSRFTIGNLAPTVVTSSTSTYPLGTFDLTCPYKISITVSAVTDSAGGSELFGYVDNNSTDAANSPLATSSQFLRRSLALVGQDIAANGGPVTYNVLVPGAATWASWPAGLYLNLSPQPGSFFQLRVTASDGNNSVTITKIVVGYQ